jgi:hypothetical protein
MATVKALTAVRLRCTQRNRDTGSERVVLQRMIWWSTGSAMRMRQHVVWVMLLHTVCGSHCLWLG